MTAEEKSEAVFSFLEVNMHTKQWREQYCSGHKEAHVGDVARTARKLAVTQSRQALSGGSIPSISTTPLAPDWSGHRAFNSV